MAIIDKVSTNSFTMEYCKFGNGTKPFVIIPGISLTSVVASADAIEEQFKIFCEDYCVYLFDRKQNINKDYLIEDMAIDTARAMNILNIKDAIIFGASQGGMIAQCIAIKYPNLVSKLILASTTSRINNDAKESLNKWIELAKNYQTDQLVASFIDNVYSKETLDTYREYLINLYSSVPNENVKQFYYLAKGTLDFDIYDELNKIQSPVLVIGGKLDKVLSIKGMFEIANKLHCDSYFYDDFGHAVYDEAPDFRNRILDFLSK